MNTSVPIKSNLRNTNSFYIKIKPYIPYIIGIISILIIIIIIVYIFTEDDKTKTEQTKDGTGTTREGTGTRRGTRTNFVGNKSLDKIYDDADGNKVLSNAQLTSTINLSTDKYSCSFLVTYKGNNERKVQCMSGCSGNDENSTFCKKYRYENINDKGSLGDTFLDQTYIGRRRGTRSSTGGN